MIRSFYIIFLISICLVSCHKDSIIVEEPEIIIPPSEEVDVYQLEGLVMDVDGTVLPEIMVQLITNSEVIDEQISDENGSFQFNDLFNDQEYFVATQSNQYPTTISSLDVESEQVALSLLSNQENSFPFQINNIDPTIDEIVIFNGLLNNDNGFETGTRIHVLGEGFDWYNYGILQGENDFHIPVKKDAVFDIYIENECGLNQLEGYGPFSMSNPIEPIEFAQEINSFTISGSVVDCEGEPLPNGEVLFAINENVQFQTQIIGGFYSQEIIGCNVTEVLVLPFGPEVSDIFPQFITDIQSDIELDLEVCAPIVSGGFIELLINGEEIPLQGGYAAEDWSEWDNIYFIHSFFPTENDINFSLIPLDNGDFGVVNLSIFTSTGSYYFGVNDEQTEVDVIDNGQYLEGTINGEVVDQFTATVKDYEINFKLMKF